MLAGAISLEKTRSLRDGDGRSLEELRASAGCTGELETVKLSPGCYHAFVELHIEQGPLLERAGVPIGIVEKIAGPSSYRVVVEGEGGHAGAVLMPDRHDACLAAAEIALAVERAAKHSGSPDTVGTTGVFRVEPGAVNSVPFRASLEIDLRDTDPAARERALSEIRRSAEETCARRGCKLTFTEVNADPPANGDAETIAIAEQVCGELNLRSQRIVSRAYHDSLFMARVCPTTMLFIPCRNGWSHRPDEYASPEHIADGVEVLAHTLARLAE
jgi:N-carbamoyl-L-amino-acid hydrolase